MTIGSVLVQGRADMRAIGRALRSTSEQINAMSDTAAAASKKLITVAEASDTISVATKDTLFRVVTLSNAFISLGAAGIKAMVAFRRFREEFLTLDGILAKVLGKIRDTGVALTTRLTVPIGGIQISALLAASGLERMEQGLAAVMGAGADTEGELKKLKEVAKLPGLGFSEAIEGSIRLQSAGFSADLARKALQNFGTALATVGAGKEELDRVTRALSQIASKGKVSAEEINQLAEVLPQIRVAMKAAFGTANTESLQGMGIDSTTFITKITEEFGKLDTVAGGARNAVENWGDAVKALFVAIGEPVLPVFTAVVGLATKAITALTTVLNSVPSPIRAIFFVIGTLIAAIGPLILLIFALGKAFLAFRSLQFAKWILATAKPFATLARSIYATQVAGAASLTTMSRMRGVLIAVSSTTMSATKALYAHYVGTRLSTVADKASVFWTARVAQGKQLQRTVTEAVTAAISRNAVAIRLNTAATNTSARASKAYLVVQTATSKALKGLIGTLGLTRAAKYADEVATTTGTKANKAYLAVTVATSNALRRLAETLGLVTLAKKAADATGFGRKVPVDVIPPVIIPAPNASKFMTAIKSIGAMVKNVAGVLVGVLLRAFTVVRIAFMALMALMVANPVAAAVAVVASLAAWFLFGNTIKEVLKEVGGAISGFVKLVVGVFALLVGTVLYPFIWAWEKIRDFLGPILRDMVGAVGTWMREQGETIREGMGVAKKGLRDAYNAMLKMAESPALRNTMVGSLARVLKAVEEFGPAFARAGAKAATGYAQAVADKMRNVPGIGNALAKTIERTFGVVSTQSTAFYTDLQRGFEKERVAAQAAMRETARAAEGVTLEGVEKEVEFLSNALGNLPKKSAAWANANKRALALQQEISATTVGLGDRVDDVSVKYGALGKQIHSALNPDGPKEKKPKEVKSALVVQTEALTKEVRLVGNALDVLPKKSAQHAAVVKRLPALHAAVTTAIKAQGGAINESTVELHQLAQQLQELREPVIEVKMDAKKATEETKRLQLAIRKPAQIDLRNNRALQNIKAVNAALDKLTVEIPLALGPIPTGGLQKVKTSMQGFSLPALDIADRAGAITDLSTAVSTLARVGREPLLAGLDPDLISDARKEAGKLLGELRGGKTTLELQPRFEKVRTALDTLQTEITRRVYIVNLKSNLKGLDLDIANLKKTVSGLSLKAEVRTQLVDVPDAISALQGELARMNLGVGFDEDVIATSIADIESALNRADLSPDVRLSLGPLATWIQEVKALLGSADFKAVVKVTSTGATRIPDAAAPKAPAKPTAWESALSMAATDASTALKQLANDNRAAFAGVAAQFQNLGPIAKMAGNKLAQVGSFVTSALSPLRPVVSTLLRPVVTVAKAFGLAGQTAKVAGGMMGQAGLSVVSALSPLGIVATFISAAMDKLWPAVEALLRPVIILAQAFGSALIPILKILFPVFKFVAVVATYLGQVIFAVAGAIYKVIGAMITALGKIIDKIPGLGDFGLKKIGKGFTDTGNALFAGADAMEAARKEIKALKWDDAMKPLEDAAKDVTQELKGIPTGFRVFNAELARFNATRDDSTKSIRPMATTIEPQRSPVNPVVESVDNSVDIDTVQVQVHQQPGQTGAQVGDEVWRQFVYRMQRANVDQGKDRYAPYQPVS